MRERIRQRFAKAHSHYAQNASVQAVMAQRLIELLWQYFPSHHVQTTLEIGCGTGNLTRQFLQHYMPNELILNDLYDVNATGQFDGFAQDCNLQFLLGDIQQLALPTQFFDVILSNAVLQWLQPLEPVLSKLHHALRDDGVLVFSSFLSDNLKQIKQLTGHGLIYDDMATLRQRVENAGFNILTVQQQHDELYFATPYAVLKHLQATGVTATGQNFRWTKSRLQQFEQDYQQFRCEQG
ncbi:MAG: malonyl-ACP O-methyltransferase BioC, partial [Acinetobacter sp.]|nr:malonyl-ACP O-methyltransferase BioC [Acinetobacter sp.]